MTPRSIHVYITLSAPSSLCFFAAVGLCVFPLPIFILRAMSLPGWLFVTHRRSPPYSHTTHIPSSPRCLLYSSHILTFAKKLSFTFPRPLLPASLLYIALCNLCLPLCSRIYSMPRSSPSPSYAEELLSS